MKALHVISGLRATAGGTVTALSALAVAQRQAGLEVSIISTFIEPETEPANALRQRGLEVHQIGPCRDPLSRHARIVPALRELIPLHDIVHIHGLWEEIQHQAARQSRRIRRPYIFSPHGMLDPWSLARGRWRKRIYLALRLRRDLQSAAAIHFTSNVERDLVAALKLRPPALLEPIGIDLGEFTPLPPTGIFRQKHPSLANRKIVLFLGRLHPKKGLDLLIPAVARLEPDTALVLAGPDEDGYQRTVERMIAENRLEDRVTLTGMLHGRERIEALVDADVMALPSYQENFGIVVIEALASGCPVVISDQVNIHREISAAGVGGVVPTKVGPLAEELRKWLSDPNLRRDAAQRGIPFVREHYDWQNIARRWVEHYRRLASAPGAK